MLDLLFGFGLLVALQLAGEALVRALGIPFPGAVAGLLMLLALLAVFGERLLGRIARAADLLLRNLTLLFFAPVAALVLDHAKFLPAAAPVAMAIFVATPLAMLVLALVLKTALPPEPDAKEGKTPSETTP
ncbi:MAG: CidA/LrgA family protein [Pseudomonadota bacterium]